MRCLMCPIMEKTFMVNGHGPFCGIHGTEYKRSAKNCHLTDFEGDGARGRAKLNEDIFMSCKELQGHRGPYYFWKILHLYSHRFAGELEIRRRVEHVHKYFDGLFDDEHARHCQSIARKIPPLFYGQDQRRDTDNDYHLGIALACFLEDQIENGFPPKMPVADGPADFFYMLKELRKYALELKRKVLEKNYFGLYC